MVSLTASRSFNQEEMKKGRVHLEGKYLSAAWMVWVAGAILAWISLTPVAWIGWLLIHAGMASRASMLIACGLLIFLGNFFLLKRVLSDLYQEDRPKQEVSHDGRQIACILALQILFALACTHLSGSFNPIGMQQWFWMPVAGFAGVLLRRRRHMILVLLITLVISTAREYIVQGPHHAVFWMFGQISTSVFIMGCSFAMTQASRQRMNTARLAAELRSANARLELQADQAAVLAVEQERNRLARDIHDSVGHSLTVVGAQLEAAEALLSHNSSRALESIQKAQRASREGLAEIRRSVFSLRAIPQDQRTLAESLTSLITSAERPGLKLALQQSGKSRSLPSLVEISLYRCAQEGITNACRHAGASEITVHLDFTAHTHVVLSVADNGRGFSQIPESSHGLKGLRERATLLNGEFFAGTGQRGGGCCRMMIPA
ncbi:sensor histidine kinase [Prosthecobacter sp.]|uniref:sensor histidine kinase n=1 Tax=Prosthecobacter sp. TaxID=1965333 RepID=UPI003782F20F